jgi:hypothetical protein
MNGAVFTKIKIPLMPALNRSFVGRLKIKFPRETTKIFVLDY